MNNISPLAYIHPEAKLCDKNNIRRADIERGLTEQQWNSMVKSAQMFSADCCKDIFNYVSKDFGKKLSF